MRFLRNLFSLPLLIAALSAGILPLSAAEQKIGVFNLETVFKGYYKTQIAEAYITTLTQEYQAALDEGAKELQLMESEYAILRDAALNTALDVVERENKRQEAETMSRRISARRVQLENEGIEKSRQLQELAFSRRQEIFNDINEAARKQAELMGFTLLLDSSARGSGSEFVPVVIYAVPRIDITQDILDDLNRGNQPPVLQTKTTETL